MVTLLFCGFIFLVAFILCGIGAEKTEKKEFTQMGIISLVLTILTGFIIVACLLECFINTLFF